MADRLFGILCFAASLTLLVAAAVLLLIDGIQWLQTGHWHHDTLLQFGYEHSLLKARWFLDHEWSWPVHDALQKVPLAAGVAAFAPIAWFFGTRLVRR